MSDWIAQYSSALDERDAREQAHKVYIDAFTKLADRTSTSHVTSRAAAASPPPPPPPPADTSRNTSAKGKAAAVDTEPSPNDLVNRLRADLAATQKARAALQAQVDELTSTLRAAELQNKTSTSQVTQLTRRGTELERKLRDRDEEIRGKSRMATEAQDEMVALGLQLNMAEQKSEKLQKDNKELLDRWMKSKREEADRMNRDSKWE